MNSYTRLLAVTLSAAGLLGAAVPAMGLTWTQVNSYSSDMVGLYHITNPDASPFQLVEAAPGFSSAVNLVVQEPTEGSGATVSSDVAAPIFGPYSLKLEGIQRIQTLDAQTNGAVSGSHSAEIWFKWDDSMTSSSFTFGFGGGATALISRDTTNPANDQFGVRSGHGDYLPLPDFSGWASMDNQWHHVAYAIDSPGSIPGQGDHNIYLSGSVMRLWLDNVLMGTVDISGEENHEAARPHIRTFGGGGVYVDEFVLWDYDVSQGGAKAAPFADGRGGLSAAGDWQLFE